MGTMYRAASSNVPNIEARRHSVSISAPVQLVILGTVSIATPYFAAYRLRIVRCSSGVGRSTKNVASNRPALKNSGGTLLILLAVQITKICDLWSLNHFRNVPNTLDVTPPSVCPLEFIPDRPFSQLILYVAIEAGLYLRLSVSFVFLVACHTKTKSSMLYLHASARNTFSVFPRPFAATGYLESIAFLCFISLIVMHLCMTRST